MHSITQQEPTSSQHEMNDHWSARTKMHEKYKQIQARIHPREWLAASRTNNQPSTKFDLNSNRNLLPIKP